MAVSCRIGPEAPLAHWGLMSLDPTHIGRFRILGTLGQGSMGTVYLAEDPKLNRGVAIKVVRAGLGDPEVLARFQREAEISAKLHHPNVITVYDVGEEPGVGPFLAMEFVDGESLSAILKRGAMPPAEALELLLQAREALEAAHRAGIVHRDLKPENFMVSKDRHLKLMDFGIARGAGAKVTKTSDFLGTPAYAAPEVLSGGQAGPASDRWAFAVSAFEMLTGRLPFPGESVGSIVYAIVHQAPVYPDGVSAAFLTLFDRALAKRPEDRHPDLKSFLVELVGAVDLTEDHRNLLERRLEGTLPGLSSSGAWAAHPKGNGRESNRWKVLALAATGLLALLVGQQLWSRREPIRKLSISSQPSGAEVTLDGQKLGRTPLREVLVKGTPRSLLVEKAEFLPETHDLGPEEQQVDVKLHPAPFTVSVKSDPPEAQVFLNGRFLGIAPLEKVEVPAEGRQVLELRQTGYEPWTDSLRRGDALPDPIRLQKLDAPEAKKAVKAPSHKAAAKKKTDKADKKGEKGDKPEEPSKIRKLIKDLFKKD
ncbi:MAG TPA: serine/threonine-protein kinase [Holophagaceae bacterium]|nr:serine/threonine-protein kinase [Holophagaceae bacterium]